MWRVTGRTAELTTDTWRGAVAIDRPQLGLHALVDPTSDQLLSVHGRIMGVELPDFSDPVPDEFVVDHYVRQNDLVINYEREQPEHIRPQIYWRYVSLTLDGHVVDGVQLLLSVQTNRLDGHPVVGVTTELQAAQVCQLSDGDEFVPTQSAARISDQRSLLLFRGDDASPTSTHSTSTHSTSTHSTSTHSTSTHSTSTHSVVQMVHPSDAVSTEVVATDVGWSAQFRLLDEHLEKGVIRRAQLAAWFVPRQHDEQLSRAIFDRFLAAPPPLTT